MRCNPLRWILLGLLLVPIMTFLAVQQRIGHIQEDLKQRTEQALRAANLPWAGSAFVGRDGLLSGKAIEEDERARAEEAVRNVWGVYKIDNGTSLIGREENYAWSAKRRNGELRLGGFVPNKATRRSIIGLAKANFPELKIDDRMLFARGVPSRNNWMGGISFGLKQLANLNKGQVTLNGLDLSISGPARDFAGYKSVKSALANRLPNGITLKQDRVTPPRVSPYAWSARHKGQQLVMTGYVPSKGIRDQIFAEAKTLFPKKTIVDRMQTALGQPNHWVKAVKRGLRQLARLDSGTLKLTDRAMVFEGVAATEPLAKDVDSDLQANLPGGFSVDRSISFVKPALKTVSPFTTDIDVGDNAITVAGYITSKEDFEAIAAALKDNFPNRRIIDNTEVAAGADKNWKTCTLIGVGAVGRLGSGKLNVSGRQLTVAGETQDETLANALPGEVRAAAGRKCDSDVRIAYQAPPEPNLLWTANWDGDQVVLDGEVPDAQTKSLLLNDAKSLFPKAQVVDRMTVVGGYHKNWRKVARYGMKMLATLRKGRSRLDAQRLSIRGEARDSTSAGAIKTGLSRDLPNSYSGRDTIDVRSDAMIWAEQEAKRKAIQEEKLRLKREAEKKQAAIEAARRAEEEKRRAIEAARRAKEEAERQAREEAEREAERKRKLELERIKLKEAKEQRQREEEARREAEEARIKAEEAWKKAQAETRRRKAAERRAKEEAARLEAEKERERAFAEAKARAEELARQRAIALEQERKQRMAMLAREEAEAAERERAAAAAAAAAALAAKQEQAQEQRAALAAKEQQRSGCERAIRDVASSGTINFKTGKSDLSRRSFMTLDALAEAADQCPEMRIEIAGHTDSDGAAAKNQRLSEKRAAAVREYLVKAGVKADRLTAIGYGETRPIARNNTRANKARNRRIEFSVKVN